MENEIVHDWDEVQQQYRDERLDLLKRVLREIPAKQLAKAAHISERAVPATPMKRTKVLTQMGAS